MDSQVSIDRPCQRDLMGRLYQRLRVVPLENKHQNEYEVDSDGNVETMT